MVKSIDEIMINSALGLALLIMTLLPACGNDQAPDDVLGNDEAVVDEFGNTFKDKNEQDEFYKNKMIRNLKTASIWMIEEGVQFFIKNGRDALFEKLVDEWGVQLWVDPWIEEDNYIVKFCIKARGIYHDIHCLYREVIENTYYEYWLIKVSSKSWAGVSGRSMFFITKTEEEHGHREILKQSDQYIESYQVENGKSIYLPIENLDLLYIMKAWNYPENYRDSDLKDKKVIIDRNGDYVYE